MLIRRLAQSRRETAGQARGGGKEQINETDWLLK